MHTPAHVVVNLTILGRKEQRETLAPIVAGAILPDLPMFFFYLYAKVLRGMPERSVWAQAYHESGWQIFFDLFNSLPLLVIGFLWARHSAAKWLSAFFASMILHSLGDFALHHSDAHRHLLPFSGWRFHSPISYWDPRHFGNIVGPLEACVIVIGCIILAKRFTSVRARGFIASLVAVYAIYWVYALMMWG
jgi:hypothetical protein